MKKIDIESANEIDGGRTLMVSDQWSHETGNDSSVLAVELEAKD